MSKERLSKLQKTILLTLLERVEKHNQKQLKTYHAIFSYSAKNYGASRGYVCASENAYEYHVYDMPFCSSFSRAIRLLEKKNLLRLYRDCTVTKISDVAFTDKGLKLALSLKSIFNNKEGD